MGPLDGVDVGAGQRLLDRLEGVLDGRLVLRRRLLALLLEELLGLVDERVGVVADLGLLPALAVLLGVGLGVAHHPVDLVPVEGRLAGDRHRLLLARRPVPGRDVDDAVGVDVERDLDLGHAPGGGRQVDELELAQRLVAVGHVGLALEDVDLDRRLPVLGGGEDLRPLGGDRRVPLDELGHDLALGLDAEGQRRDVKEEDVLHLALEHTGLDGGTDGHDLVGVHALVGLLAGHLLDQRLDGRHPGGTTHQDHVADR